MALLYLLVALEIRAPFCLKIGNINDGLLFLLVIDAVVNFPLFFFNLSMLFAIWFDIY